LGTPQKPPDRRDVRSARLVLGSGDLCSGTGGERHIEYGEEKEVPWS
jgi:hypothetical protein